MMMSARETIDDLLQARLELRDPVILEQFWFTDDQHVTATIGEKNGAVCGPILAYRITDQDVVVIGDDNTDWYHWEDIRVEGNLLHVHCDGRTKVFTIERQKPRRRFLP